jgi:hypothetical protein
MAQRRIPGSYAAERVLPVRDGLAELMPWGGLRRGSTVAVRGSAALLLALLAAATAAGSWAAVAGLPGLGVLAAAELGVAVHRLALVPKPGSDPAPVLAALLDGVDLVVVSSAVLLDPARPGPGVALARRLSARARHRGAVLLPFGPWPGADLELTARGVRWSGIGQGHGYLREREIEVAVRGRGAAGRPFLGSVVLGADSVAARADPGPADVGVGAAEAGCG